jgi:aminoglycoside phosphotransferase (APT) family kinase protein
VISKENVQDIQKILSPHFPNIFQFEIGKFEEILGGADTRIFSFSVKDLGHDFILRIYREGTSVNVAKIEYQTLQAVHSANVAVPKPYGYLGDESSFERAILIMEKIVGKMLAEAFFEEQNDRNILISKFVENLVQIHHIPWEDEFKDVIPPDIKADPFVIIKGYLRRPVELVEKYSIHDLKPLILWLQDNMHKHPCNDLVLVHGDYHAMNIMIAPNGDLVTLDWANVRLGDRRIDIAFALTATESASEIPLRDAMLQLYHQFANINIEGIEYFIVLSNLHNLIRMYSMLVNYEITRENDKTKAILVGNYRNYSSYVVKTIMNITGLSFAFAEKTLI